MEIFLHIDTWIALLTLTFLEIVLGIDNIIFIAIIAGKLPKNKQKKATNLGLLLAMAFRIILLAGVSLIIGMKAPFYIFNLPWMEAEITGQGTILIAGGLFLLYKSTSEIHHKVEGNSEKITTKTTSSFTKTLFQIVLLDAVFSIDSVLTAVGMTNGIHGSLTIMIIAVVASIFIMMLFATSIGKFVNKHPSIQMLALSFLILIGFMLITEGAHLWHLTIFEQKVGAIPKGYLYFAIAFSIAVEALNMKIRKKN